jgi:hypothetical protein
LPVRPNPSEAVGVVDGDAVLDHAGVVEGVAVGSCDVRGAGVGL